MSSSKRSLVLAILACVLAVRVHAQEKVAAPYDTDYHVFNLGPVPGVPLFYGGLAFLAGDPNTLLIGGHSIGDDGAIYKVGVVRDANRHIVGYSPAGAFLFSEAPLIDGGLAYGPGDVLFLSRFIGASGQSSLGETKPGSTMTDKVVDLSAVPLNVPDSLGGIDFVPAGYPGAGQTKIVSFNDAQWYTLTLAPDAGGTFDVTAATAGPVLFNNGPEGFFYVPAGRPQFPLADSILLSEFFGSGNVVTFQIDANGDPLPATRALFVADLLGAQGAVVDPVTGDFLFSTFSDAAKVIVARTYECTVDADCDDGNVCTTETCDTGAGKCVYTDNDGVACDDGLFCTGSDTCAGGTCSLHTGDPCAGLPECQNFCLEGLDTCGNTPNGLACSDDGFECTHDVCSGDGNCVHEPLTPGSPCSDEGNLCTVDACDDAGMCVHTPEIQVSNCLSSIPGKSPLSVKTNANPAKSSLTWKFQGADLVGTAVFGDPIGSTDYQLCVFTQDVLGLDALAPHGDLCGSKPCWKATKSGFKYADKAATPDGLTSIVLKVDKKSHPSLVVKGKGANLDPLPQTLATPVTVQLKSSDGACFSASYSAPAKNAAGTFKSNAD